MSLWLPPTSWRSVQRLWCLKSKHCVQARQKEVLQLAIGRATSAPVDEVKLRKTAELADAASQVRHLMPQRAWPASRAVRCWAVVADQCQLGKTGASVPQACPTK